jgi:transcription elongation factor SPT5
LRIYRSIFAFLHSREITENQGVFVVRCNNLGPVDPRSDASASTSLDLSKMNPALGRPAPKSGVVMSNLRHLINTRVVITKGSYKGLIGIIKDMSGEKARVELATNNRVVDQLVTNLKRKE